METLRTTLLAMSMLSLVFALLAITSGAYRAKGLIVTLLVACAFAGLAVPLGGGANEAKPRGGAATARKVAASDAAGATVIDVGADGSVTVSGPGAARTERVDGNAANGNGEATSAREFATGAALVMGALFLLAAAAVAARMGWSMAGDAARRRSARRRREAETRDPLHVARLHAHDMIGAVEEAVGRVARLRSSGGPLDAEDAEAVALATTRLPSVMATYAAATAAADDRRDRERLARMALGAVVDIGEAAERATRRRADALRDRLDAETRYVAGRAGVGPIALD